MANHGDIERRHCPTCQCQGYGLFVGSTFYPFGQCWSCGAALPSPTAAAHTCLVKLNPNANACAATPDFTVGSVKF